MVWLIIVLLYFLLFYGVFWFWFFIIVLIVCFWGNYLILVNVVLMVCLIYILVMYIKILKLNKIKNSGKCWIIVCVLLGLKFIIYFFIFIDVLWKK